MAHGRSDGERAEPHAEDVDEKVSVNPAARRDSPEAPATERDEEDQRADPVPPTQEEPLDPLGPGGIGE